jgi:hypothetical protein
MRSSAELAIKVSILRKKGEHYAIGRKNSSLQGDLKHTDNPGNLMAFYRWQDTLWKDGTLALH